MARQAFVVYKLVVQAAGGISREVPLRDFTHDLEAMEQAISARTRIVFLANPNNPTGTIYRKARWQAFLKQVPPDVLIIVDEAYFEYVEAADYPDSLDYHQQGKTLLTLRTFSKLYGLAGLRIGYGIANEDVISLMHRVRQPFNVNAPAQWAALAALNDSEHVRRSLDNNREGLEYLTAEFARLGIEYVPSHANFILLRVGKGEDVFNRLLAQGIIVRPMAGYQFPEYLRVTIGIMDENRKFIDGLKKAFAA
jgi:histidinol-phosphate aminotransferase